MRRSIEPIMSHIVGNMKSIRLCGATHHSVSIRGYDDDRIRVYDVTKMKESTL